MRCSTRHCFLTSAGITLLWVLLNLKVPGKIEDGQNEARNSSRKYLRQEDWNDLTFKYMEKLRQKRKTWLTVGISSVPQTDQTRLVHTLTSLFSASSKSEQKRFMVLVHLVHTDFTWIGETTARISSLFSLQILAGQLLLIRTPPDAYPSMDGLEEEACREECYLKQNIDYAFLMSFAAKFSDYFLLMEDDIFCVPNFVTHIYSKVTDLKPNPWVLLEFSDTGVGKLFHSSDLPLLAHFFLLFYKEKPSDKLMEHFRTLLLQEEQIFCTPFLFYQSLMDDEKEEATQIQKKLYGPDNPPGAIVTTMQVFSAHFPWEAYTLDESFFWTYNVSAGQHLTVILNHPANLRRVQVMTGSIMDGTYALEKGHVELGYDPQGMPQHCSSFALLGQLQDGQLDQEILVKNMSSHVSCVKLVVKASQADGLMIRHIYLWEENAKEEKVDQS